MTGKDLEFYEKETPPDQDIKEFMDEEIAHAPQAPNELKERLSEHNSSSPADSGGDVDASEFFIRRIHSLDNPSAFFA